MTQQSDITLSTTFDTAWTRLRLFNYYRITLALFFVVLYFNGWLELVIPEKLLNHSVFSVISVSYLATSILMLPMIRLQKPALTAQVILQFCIDLSCILLLMHAVGGVRSGLGMLLIINIAISSLYLPLRTTLLFAALATVSLLLIQIYTQLTVTLDESYYVQTAFLGMLFFTAAYLTSKMSHKLRQTEILAAEQSEELESAVQMSEQIIRNMRTGILVVRQDGAIEMANKAARNLLSNAYIEDNTPLDSVSPKLFQRFVEWQFGVMPPYQKPVQQSHGLPDIQPGFSNIEPKKGKQGRTLIFLEDATQLNQRFQQMKLASLGRLTASIAHEIRNPLAAIHHASQLLEEANLDKADAKLSGIISTQARRLNTIVENVLQLSRQQRGSPETIQLKSWLENFKDEFCKSRGLQLEQFRLAITPEDTQISFDPSQLHQVIWNLCNNSIDHSGLPPENLIIDIQGGYSYDAEQPFIDIIDNGQGIDADTALQIFEPFYTTSAEGTGLGLYITKEVIESNRAKITHISLPNGGTCFRIYFIQQPDAGPNNTETR